MADVTLTHIRKSFGPIDVIKGVDLEINAGEFVVFVGPSGCGKSTLLRMISGLEDITSGELRIDGEVMNDVDPSKRGIAMVFQSYALYPHMTVRENMGFALKYAKVPKDEIDRLVNETAAIRLTGTLGETDYWDYVLHGSLLPLQNNFRFGTSHGRKFNLAGSKTDDM